MDEYTHPRSPYTLAYVGIVHCVECGKEQRVEGAPARHPWPVCCGKDMERGVKK